MKTAVLVTPRTETVPRLEADYFGVDAGCLVLIEAGIPMKMAVGDFDSMAASDLEKIKKRTEVEIHPVMKDETDTELAVRSCREQGYDKIIVTGAVSGRLDHTIANLVLLRKYPQMVLMDEFHYISCLREGIHLIENDYKHVSFFAPDGAVLSLCGFLWPLDHRQLNPDDIYAVSNSIIEDKGIVTVHQGRVLCIQSNYR